MDTNVGQFGFLPICKTISFSGEVFALLEDFNETMTALRSATNADGLVYLPLEKRMRGEPGILDGNSCQKINGIGKRFRELNVPPIYIVCQLHMSSG